MRPKIASLSAASLIGLAMLTGTQAQAAVGGPDAFGYTFVDQDDGQPFAYFDISATGTLVVSGDDVLGSVTLAQPFTFYGVTYTDFIASTNGFLTDLAATGADFSNDCPLPAVPGSGAGSFRIAALHDDLITDVYYQYIDEATAAALGFPGQTQGVSIFQWQGQHFNGAAGGVDVEVALSHTFGDILSIVQTDVEGGEFSTMGIQDPSGTIGLNYTCNTAGGVVPGVTAVAYFDPALGGAGTDCCAPSQIAAPGCSDPVCEASVCAADAFCCNTEWDATCAAQAALLCTQCPPPVTINEIRIDQPSTDNDEYFELAGPPGAALDGVTYLVLGDSPTGNIEAAIDLTGQVIPASGLFVAAEGSFTLGTADFTTTLNFENDDTVTHMLVANFTGSTGDNVDADADGVFDATPWSLVLDQVAVVNPAGGELPYGPPLACDAGPICGEVTGASTPQHAYRCPDIDGGWFAGEDDRAAAIPTDTPGAPNPCACGDGIVNGPEECDDVVESAVCDTDCTFATCGDGVVNVTALEDCDDSGESATCNADCTTSSCGDGVLNTTAGEACDDGGESATCNADCTVAACGDGIINNTAGETCDDMGRSATCNDDCTTASCGDGIVNLTAGEECDGDGAGTPGETATCDDDCTTAMCGDMVANAAAGEDCDDGAESATCDDDCTDATCGDGTMNATAGEECDDGNTDDGDGCASDCTTEDPGGSTGTDSGGMDTGDTGDGDSTGGPDSTGDGADSTGGPGGDSNGLTTGVTTLPGDGSGDDGGSDGSGDSTGGAASDDSGCGCTTGDEQGTTWTLLTLFGLFGLRRRRRS